MPNQALMDQPASGRQASLFVFIYCCDSLQRLRASRSILLGLAIAGANCAVWSLLRFLYSYDEREQQINYRALTFAFIGTLIFSLAIGFALSIGFHSVSWLGIPALTVILWSFGPILYSWRYR